MACGLLFQSVPKDSPVLVPAVFFNQGLPQRQSHDAGTCVRMLPVATSRRKEDYKLQEQSLTGSMVYFTIESLV